MTNAISSNHHSSVDSIIDPAGTKNAVAIQNKETTKTAQADGASLSSTASALATSATTSDVRADKVSAIKAALDAGTYHVPASAVADSIIKNMLG